MNSQDSLQQPEETSPAPREHAVSLQALMELLRSGTLELQGILPWSSNYTFLAVVQSGEVGAYAVYKPRKGERPLWDFPAGSLCAREVAAFLVSEALGWSLVPPTVLRDGPHGEGSVQFFVDADHEQHYFTLRERFPEQFQRMAAFDALINNADRKGGHCLLDTTDHVWAIDHGIAFHEQDKLRTVIWEWAGQPIPESLLADIRRLDLQLGAQDGPLPQALGGLLAPGEITAMRRRIKHMLSRPLFPSPGPGRSVPWPSI